MRSMLVWKSDRMSEWFVHDVVLSMLFCVSVYSYHLYVLWMWGTISSATENSNFYSTKWIFIDTYFEGLNLNGNKTLRMLPGLFYLGFWVKEN